MYSCGRRVFLLLLLFVKAVNVPGKDKSEISGVLCIKVGITTFFFYFVLFYFLKFIVDTYRASVGNFGHLSR